MARVVQERLDSVDWTGNADAETAFGDLAAKTEWVSQNLVPNLWSGPQAADTLLGFLTSVDMQVSSFVSPEQIRSSLSLPATLKKYVSAANARLEAATKTIDGIEAKVSAINAAYDSAERLPATHADLADALAKVDKAAVDAERLNAKSSSTSAAVDALRSKLDAADKEAQATLEKVRQAYRAATSQGLAQAFSDKSRELNRSMLTWVLILLGALLAAGLLMWKSSMIRGVVPHHES